MSAQVEPANGGEYAEAAWALQSWVRSCYDVTGVCALCGSPDPAAHVNECPWPRMRGLLDREPASVRPS